MGIALFAAGPSGGAVLTALNVLVPVFVGLWVLRVAERTPGGISPGTWVGLAVAGGLVLVTWAGFLLDPVILLGAAVVPRRDW